MDAWIASSYLPDVLRRFSAGYPKIAIDILTSEFPPAQLERTTVTWPCTPAPRRATIWSATAPTITGAETEFKPEACVQANSWPLLRTMAIEGAA